MRQTPCGPAWGHDGGVPSAYSYSLTSPDGTRQAVLMATRDANTWTTQIGTDFATALLTAFCGEVAPSAAARSLAATMTSEQLMR
jgi:D-alanyl-D-alanine carboxypeptidase